MYYTLKKRVQNWPCFVVYCSILLSQYFCLAASKFCKRTILTQSPVQTQEYLECSLILNFYHILTIGYAIFVIFFVALRADLIWIWVYWPLDKKVIRESRLEQFILYFVTIIQIFTHLIRWLVKCRCGHETSVWIISVTYFKMLNAKNNCKSGLNLHPKKISSAVDNWYLDEFFWRIHLRQMIYLSRAEDISSMSAD
jgi:hypothetical protein